MSYPFLSGKIHFTNHALFRSSSEASRFWPPNLASWICPPNLASWFCPPILAPFGHVIGNLEVSTYTIIPAFGINSINRKEARSKRRTGIKGVQLMYFPISLRPPLQLPLLVPALEVG